jgi:hypothetical protein
MAELNPEKNYAAIKSYSSWMTEKFNDAVVEAHDYTVTAAKEILLHPKILGMGVAGILSLTGLGHYAHNKYEQRQERHSLINKNFSDIFMLLKTFAIAAQRQEPTNPENCNLTITYNADWKINPTQIIEYVQRFDTKIPEKKEHVDFFEKNKNVKSYELTRYGMQQIKTAFIENDFELEEVFFDSSEGVLITIPLFSKKNWQQKISNITIKLLTLAKNSCEQTSDHAYSAACEFTDYMGNKLRERVKSLTACNASILKYITQHESFSKQYISEKNQNSKTTALLSKNKSHLDIIMTLRSEVQTHLHGLSKQQLEINTHYIYLSRAEQIIHRSVLEQQNEQALIFCRKANKQIMESSPALDECVRWCNLLHHRKPGKTPEIVLPQVEEEPAVVGVAQPNPDQALWKIRRAEYKKARMEERAQTLEQSVAPVLQGLLNALNNGEQNIVTPSEQDNIINKHQLLFDLIRYLEIMRALSITHGLEKNSNFIARFRNCLVHPKEPRTLNELGDYSKGLVDCQKLTIDAIAPQQGAISKFGISQNVTKKLIGALETFIKPRLPAMDEEACETITNLFRMFYDLCAELDAMRTNPNGRFPRVFVMWLAKMGALRESIKERLEEEQFTKLCQHVPIIRMETFKDARKQRQYSMHYSPREQIEEAQHEGENTNLLQAKTAYYASVKLDTDEPNIAKALSFVQSVDTRVLRRGIDKFCAEHKISYSAPLNPDAAAFDA